MNTDASGPSIDKVGIVGGGRMGEAIFYHLNDFDFSLVWVVRREGALDKAQGTFERKLRRLHRAGAIDDDAYAFKQANTILTCDRADLRDCDLIIETIIEDIEIKRALFKELDQIVNADCIFVSNSSSIKPSRICPDSERKTRFAGLHFFFPVRFNRSVELVGSDTFSADGMQALMRFAERIGKKPLVLPEQGAFILNKTFIYCQAQAFHTHRENILSYRQIDELVKRHVFSMGTFEFLDHVGLDVILSSAKNYLEDMDHKDFITITIEEVQKVVDQGRLGVKSGRGFFSYGNDEAPDDEAPDLKQIGEAARRDYEREVVNKTICLYVNCAYGFVDKGYCSEADLDEALGEYKGMDKGPVTLAGEIGFGNVHDMLTRYHRECGEEVFRPSPSLTKRAQAAEGVTG